MRAILLTVFLALIALSGDAQIGKLGIHIIGSTNTVGGVGGTIGGDGVTVLGNRGAIVNIAGSDADADDYFLRITTNGGGISLNSKSAVTVFVQGCKTDGTWDKLIDVCPLAGSNLVSALVRLKVPSGLSSAYTNVGPFVSGDYTEATGLKAGPGKALTGGFIAANYLTVTNAHVGIFMVDDGQSDGWDVLELNSVSQMLGIIARYIDGNSIGALWSNPTTGQLVTNGNGYFLSSRIGTTDLRVYQNGVQQGATITTSAGTMPTVSMELHSSGSPNRQMGFICFGTGLTSTESSNLSVRVTALMTSFGRIPTTDRLDAVFFGDSVTAGNAASTRSKQWAQLVADAINYNRIDKGIAGTVLQNTVPTQANNGRDRYAATIPPFNPDRIYILYGLNDLRYNNVAYTQATFQNDLGEIVNGLISTYGFNATNIYLGSPSYMIPASYTNVAYTPFDGGTVLRHQQHRDAVSNVAGIYHTKFADVYQVMLDGGADTLMNADGVHPNDAGHQKIADTFNASVQQ